MVKRARLSYHLSSRLKGQPPILRMANMGDREGAFAEVEEEASAYAAALRARALRHGGLHRRRRPRPKRDRQRGRGDPGATAKGGEPGAARLCAYRACLGNAR